MSSVARVFAVMPDDSPHLGDVANRWAVNFRVADLDAIVGQLRHAEIDVEVDPERYPNGRFANLRDPEGDLVQLWEPDGTDLLGPE